MIDCVLAVTVQRVAVGAEYGDAVFERWITIRTESAYELLVLDHNFEVLDAPVNAGERIEALVEAVLFSELDYPLSLVSQDRAPHKYEGVVGAMISKGEFPQFRYSAVESERVDSYVCVSLPFGPVVVSVPTFKHEIRIGERVGWDRARYDVIAIR